MKNNLPYGDKYIKYPLPIDKSTVDWNLAYMKEGGSQLVEILEKEFSVEWIKEHQEELKIPDSHIEKMEYWIKFNLKVGSIMKPLNIGAYSGSMAKNFFYRGTGILRKLFKIIDVSPIWDGEKFESKYSFVEYDRIENEIGVIFVSKFNFGWDKLYFSEKEIKSTTKVFCFSKTEDSLVPLNSNDELYKDLMNSYEIYIKMSS